MAEQGERLAEVLAEAERAAMALRGERSGPVRIGGFSTILRRLVGPAVVDLAIAEPSIVPSVTEVDAANGLAQLRAGELDLLLLERRPDAAPPRGIPASEDLLRDAYRVVVPTTWPVHDNPGTLLRGRWIAGARGHARARRARRPRGGRRRSSRTSGICATSTRRCSRSSAPA